MPYLSDQELSEARRRAADARYYYCAACQAETPHLNPNYFKLLRRWIGGGRVCLTCGWAHVHKPIKNKNLRQAVLDADNHECVYCGRVDRLGLDHVMPQSRGGASTFDNLVTACHWCNTRRRDGRVALAARYGRFRGGDT